MRVSIIIPAYNEEALIHHTLESIRKQDYQDGMEVIVVDNQSTDGTARIAAQSGARVVRELRRGYVFALMTGFRHATGDILITTDADTIVPSNWVSTLVRPFKQSDHVVAVGGTLEFYDANWKGNLFARRILPMALAYERHFSSHSHLWGANMAIRREAFRKAGGWTGRFNLHADTDLSRRLARIGKVVTIKNLRVSTSARRYNQALVRNLFVYGINFLSLQLLNRPAFFHFRPVRRTASPVWKGPHVRRRKWAALSAIALAFALSHTDTLSGTLPAGHSSVAYVRHTQTKEKVIALTFDDGPNEPYTSQILKILQHNGVRATFFLIGENVKLFPAAAREIVAEGHQVGNHSYSHPFFLALEPSRYEGRQIDRTEQIVEAATGVHCMLFRPPHGLHTPWLLRAAAKRGLISVGWSENASDWHRLTSAQIADRIVRAARPGNIILLHDGLNLAHGIDRSQTVNALPAMISELKRQGYTFVTVSELLDKKQGK